MIVWRWLSVASVLGQRTPQNHQKLGLTEVLRLGVAGRFLTIGGTFSDFPCNLQVPGFVLSMKNISHAESIFSRPRLPDLDVGQNARRASPAKAPARMLKPHCMQNC